jgi:hypothetical protein
MSIEACQPHHCPRVEVTKFRLRKAAANLEKVEERQKSESLKIQLKTSQQQLGALTDKLKQYEEQKTSLEFEGEAVAERQKEVRCSCYALAWG